MLPSQRPKFGRQGEGQQKILGRDLFFELPFQPLLDEAANAAEKALAA